MAIKIGILTFQWADNYGGLLQCFALKNYLNNQGYEATVINYWPSYALTGRSTRIGQQAVKKQFGKSVWPNRKQMLKKILLGRYCYEKQITEKDDLFRKKYLTANQSVCFDGKDIEQIIGVLDVLICGSDQIWNPNLTGGRFDENYFLGFPGSKAIRLSFAASLGVSLNPKWEREFQTLLSGLRYISTRERSLAELIQTKFGLSATAVLDPVFLLEAQDWNQLLPKKKKKEPYILVYSIHRGTEIVSAANWLSEKTNLPLHIIGSRRRYKNARYFLTCSVEEFLHQFKNADYILTNSFHGTAFSLIFQKNFITILESEKPTRMIDLLTDIGLAERIYTDNSREVILEAPDYVHANVILRQKIQESKAFLNTSILSVEDSGQ